MTRRAGLLLLAILLFQIVVCAAGCDCSSDDTDGCLCCGQFVSAEAPLSAPPATVVELLVPSSTNFVPSGVIADLDRPPRS
jgi:hypothetical protein